MPGSDETVRTLNVDGFSYTLHLSPEHNWTTARERCQADGRDLLRLYSKEHGANVSAAVTAFLSEAFHTYWLGLSSAAQQTMWVWSLDGVSLSATEADWASGEPTYYNNTPRCAMAQAAPGAEGQAYWQWIGEFCTNASPFVCGPGPSLAAQVRAFYLVP